jgi:WD40 repeat protein
VPDGKTATTRFRSWDVSSGEEKARVWTLDRKARQLAYSADGRVLAELDSKDRLRLWDAATGKQIRQVQGCVSFFDFSRDGRLLAARAPDQSIRVIEVATGQERCRFRGHHQSFWCGSFSPDSQLLATGSADTTITFWRVRAATFGKTRGSSRRYSAQEMQVLWNELDAEPAKPIVPLEPCPMQTGKRRPSC